MKFKKLFLLAMGTATIHGENDLIGWTHYHLGRKVLQNGKYVVEKYKTKPYRLMIQLS